MTRAYREAKAILKQHVGAGPDDVILVAGSGMTAVVNKLQRILGLRLPDTLADRVRLADHERPVVFVTHMEHHSNQTSWLETICDVVVVDPDEAGLVCPVRLDDAVRRYRGRPLIGAFTACSNVTGIETPIHDLARVMHAHGGLCFADYAAGAPYLPIDMHPAGDPDARLDAVYFSPHKFLGGPGTPGVLVFDRSLYRCRVPDHPGGGTVRWTDPWGGHTYLADVEKREDGGTPGFLQTIRAAMAVRLKEAMGTDAMRARERELLAAALPRLRTIPGVEILADPHDERIGVVAFVVKGWHHNLVVRLLNDRFGVMARGGCSCAGTYGHYLLHLDPTRSKAIFSKVDTGDVSERPGWVRLSIHPTMTDAELDYVLGAIEETVQHLPRWAEDYTFSAASGEYTHRSGDRLPDVRAWFDV
jgi:selenocysteine lyase/cysteine desulfurase